MDSIILVSVSISFMKIIQRICTRVKELASDYTAAVITAPVAVYPVLKLVFH
jgi:hypothetical protein